MNAEPVKHQKLRFIASGMVTLFLIIIITNAFNMLLMSSDHLLWGIPVIAVSLLDIYFLTRSLLHEPKKIDTRLSTLIISIGATFGFSLVAISIADHQFELPYIQVIKQVGRLLSILPYLLSYGHFFVLRIALQLYQKLIWLWLMEFINIQGIHYMFVI